ncbi:hypothetical protein P691DRAFT_779402 [Macrolepiota fuliginosa MF-IS2]|uniref:DUF6534 domain-containing protein n=1 Tax=Macrolepiota fuliginosa MF-IS2 TaxID=1400762 RepID=A0A9P6BW34_9AGAR|nr:hypothetical protein P691DRAFT_779402 [Macrolepiota fuliginosa MF-IS2]
MAGESALFGYCTDIFLYGILTVQTYLYYLAFPKDKWQVKSIVYFVYIVGAMQTAFALRDFYTLFCIEDTERVLLSTAFGPHRFGFMWFTVPVSSALVAVVAQLFYAHRIYTIFRGKVITIIVSILAILQFACGITSAAIVYNPRGPDLSNLSSFVGRLVDGAAWGSVGAICDIVIAVYMSYSLSKQLARAPRTTQDLLTRIKRLVVETGIVTAAMAAAYVFTSIFAFEEPWYLIPGLSLSKLYSNSVLVLLNNRLTILGGRNAPHPESDVALYRRSNASDARDRAVVSGLAFAHSRTAEATLTGDDIHTVGLMSPSGRAPTESSEVGREDKHVQKV